MAQKIALKIPKVLATLGRAIEIKGEHVHYKFSKKDDVRLVSPPGGKTLFCIKVKKLKTSYADFLQIWNKHKSKSESAAELYEKWNDYEAMTGSLVKIPSGFLYRVDRCFTIVYESGKWTGKLNKYIHEFKKQPIMWVNNKTAPTVLKLSGGAINVTARGITG